MLKWRSAAWLPAILLILIQAANGMRNMSQLAFFLIYLQERLELRTVTISNVFAGGQVAGMVTALISGAIASRLGGKWVLVTGLAFACLGSLAFQARTLWPVAMLWFTGGAGMALATVGSASLLTRISARGARGIFAALYTLSMTAGGALGNPLAAFLIDRYGFNTFTWASISLSVMTILVVLLLMPDFQDHRMEPVLPGSFWSGVLNIARQTNIRLLVGLRCLPTIFYGALTVLIPLLINSLSGSKALVAAYGTTNLIVASAAQLLAGRAADRWGARRPTLAAYSAVLLSGLGLAISASTVWGLFIFGVLGIAAAWSLSTLMYVWISDGVPKSEHLATFGLLQAVWSLSMITGSLIGGWFSSESLPGLPFLIAGLFNLGSFFLTFAYYNVKQKINHKGHEERQLPPAVRKHI